MSQHVHTPIQAQIQAANRGSGQPDLLVVGAGIFGLWAARHALKRGERVLVVEKRNVGAGASGGFLGALMPHMPDRWNEKKRMQYEGLHSLEQSIAELEADTGADCGYRRCGRLMPLRHEKMLHHLEERIAGAGENWVDVEGKQAFTLEHIPQSDLASRFALPDGKPWLSPEIAPFGAAHDTLSARVNPRAYLAALAQFVRGHDNGTIVEGAGATSIDPAAASASLGDGSKISAGRIVIANGWESYDLLAGIRARVEGQKVAGQMITGRGVKGQAVLLDLPHDDNLPILYDSGSYIVPHGAAMGVDGEGVANCVAVGSTSVDDWLPEGASEEVLEAARTGYDAADTGFFDHACELCPALASASVVERWANVRPRNTIPDPNTGKIGAEPVFGRLEGHDRVSVVVGGFKISFGIAHLPHG